MSASTAAVYVWDEALYDAAVRNGDGDEHLLVETEMRGRCVDAIKNLVPLVEQNSWAECGTYIPEEESTTDLMRRLMTNKKSAIDELPTAMTLFTRQVALRFVFAYRCARSHSCISFAGGASRRPEPDRSRVEYGGRPDGNVKRRSRRGAAILVSRACAADSGPASRVVVYVYAPRQSYEPVACAPPTPPICHCRRSIRCGRNCQTSSALVTTR